MTSRARTGPTAAVDEFDLDEASDGGETPPSSSARPRRRQAWPWVIAAAALVGLGATNAAPVAVAQGVGSGADMSLLDLDLRDEPVTVWTADIRFPEVVLAEGGRAVVLADDDGAGRSVLGIDLGTGDEVWRYYDVGYTCTWSASIVCLVDPGTPEATIVEIDRSDGTRVAHTHPGALAAIAAGDDLVVIEATGRSDEAVTLLGADGSERWRVAVDAVDSESSPFWVQLEIVGDRLMVYQSGLSVELATGAVSPVIGWWYLDDVTLEVSEDGYLVHTREGTVALERTEMLIRYDDDLGGPVALAQDQVGGLVATLRDDGTELWRQPATDSGCYPMARLRGVVVSQCWGEDGDRLLGLDLLTGDEVWARPAPALPMGASADTVLVIDYREGHLLALDVTTGAPRWNLPIRVNDTSGITELSNGILVTTGSALVRLLWD